MFTLGEHISPFVEKGSAENFPSKTTLRDFWPILKFFRVKVKFKDDGRTNKAGDTRIHFKYNIG